MTANCQFLHKVHSARKHQCQDYFYIIRSMSKYCNFILLSATVNMCLPKTNHRWIEEWIQNLHQFCTSQRCVLEVTSSVHLHFPLRYSVNNTLLTYVIHSSVIVQHCLLLLQDKTEKILYLAYCSIVTNFCFQCIQSQGHSWGHF